MGKQGASGGGGRAARALRLALLVVFALAAVEYIYSYVLETSPLKSYIYPPFNYNNTERDETRSTTRDEPSKTSTKAVPTDITLKIVHNSLLSQNNTAISHDISVIPVSEYTPIPDIHQNESTTLLSKLVKAVTSSTNTPTVADDVKSIEFNISDLPQCEVADDLGPVTVNKSAILTLKDIDQKYPQVLDGGIHLPNNCSTQDKVAIIVPFRDRQQHLAIFLNHIHPFLMKQPIEYGIYIVEQYDNTSSKFNRAKLFNVGYAEAQRLTKNHWKCFVFHDVDLLPLDTRNLYTCPRQPRHMSVAVDILNFSLPYKTIFGGVSALTVQQFQYVNGFPNRYWGWGGEDDDMSHRYQLLSQGVRTIYKDGLTNLYYKVVKVQQFHLFTHILANIDEKS